MASLRRDTVPTIDYSAFAKANELKNRIFFTICALIVFRLGAYIPIPGINAAVLEEISKNNAEGVLGMFNMLSGGSLGRMSVFALSIMPYITASIIMQLLSVLSKTIESIKKEGDSGRKKIAQYTRYGTVLLSIFQGFGLAVSLESMGNIGEEVVSDPGLFFRITTIVTLVGGTVFLMWLGEQITARGIGNGTSLIIFSGIVAGLPSAIAGTFELGRTGAFSSVFILLLMVTAVFLVFVIVYVERAHRKILVQYPKRQQGNKMLGGESTHLPLKLNTAGVVPPIFASALLLFPITMVNFSNSKGEDGIMNEIVQYLAHGKPLYILLYIGLICLFAFYYTAIIFNPDETAENLKKYGGFIPGRRPGKHTAEFLDFVLTRLTVVGVIYLSIICVVPEILISKYSVPFYLGGTSILIVVNVVMDTMTQIQTHLFSHQYEGLLKKSRLRDKK